IAQDAQSDVANNGLGEGPSVLCDPATNAIQAVEFYYTGSHWVFLDPKMEADFGVIRGQVSGDPDLTSRDRADQKWVVAARRSDAPASYYIFNRATQKLTKLYDELPALSRLTLAPKKPVVIPARDGLQLVSYLTTPPGVEAKQLPLVLLIHGGP